MDDRFENVFEARNRHRMTSHFEWTREYTRNHFKILRIEDGRIREMWN